MMKSLAIELFKDENSKPYSFKSKAMDRVCFEGGDKIPDTFNRIRIAPFGESTRNSEHLIEITLSQEGYIDMVIPEGYTISRLVGGEIKLIPNSNK